jgi:hypothetical protein
MKKIELKAISTIFYNYWNFILILEESFSIRDHCKCIEFNSFSMYFYKPSRLEPAVPENLVSLRELNASINV